MAGSIVLFIGSLLTGGAERQCLSLAKELAKNKHDVTIVTLIPGGNCRLIANTSIKHVSLFNDKSGNKFLTFIRILISVRKLRKLLKKTNNKQYLYCFSELNNLIGYYASIKLSTVKLIWGVRTSGLPASYVKLYKFIHVFSSKISINVPLIISNSQQGVNFINRLNYKANNILCVRNGYEVFPSIKANNSVSMNEIVVGTVGRITSLKDPDCFVRVAAYTKKFLNNVRFVWVGPDSGSLPGAKSLAKRMGVSDIIEWVGESFNVSNYYNDFDIYIQPSKVEGCSNSLCEAMLHGLPCVATDAGDNEFIINNQSYIVKSGDHVGLAEAIISIANLSDDLYLSLCHHNKKYAEQQFSIHKLCQGTLDAFAKI